MEIEYPSSRVEGGIKIIHIKSMEGVLNKCYQHFVSGTITFNLPATLRKVSLLSFLHFRKQTYNSYVMSHSLLVNHSRFCPSCD